MSLTSLLLDVGNVMFFAGGLPQLITTIKNKDNLKGISPIGFLMYSIGCMFFLLMSIVNQAWMATIFNIFNVPYFGIVAYWSWKANVKGHGRRAS
jgi:uncharacterized protein with PQ loop repeat